MKYETILFDVDDTLFDFKLSQQGALHKAFVEHHLPTGLADYEDSYKAISTILWGELEKGNMILSELGVERFKRLFAEHTLDINPKDFNTLYLGYLGKEIHLIEGALELCHHLSDCQLAIITNGFSEVQRSRISGSPLRDTFKHIIISEDTGFQKPHSGIFDHAFSVLNITDKSKVLIIGDSLTSDIQGGNNYGIDTCWYNPQGKENTTTIKPTYEIHSLLDVIELIQG